MSLPRSDMLSVLSVALAAFAFGLAIEGEFWDFLSGRRLVFRAPGEEVVVPRQPRPEVIPPLVNGHRRVTVMVTVVEWTE